MSKKILVVEDDSSMREIIVEFLKDAGFEISQAENGKIALDLLAETSFDMLITDIMMPVLNGFQLVNAIRKTSSLPIICLTALSGEPEQIKAYDLAIDDYITKPFSPIVLVKKVQAMFKRIDVLSASNDNSLVNYIKIDKKKWIVIIDDKSVQLSVKELEVFSELLKTPDSIVTREQLLSRVWGFESFDDTRVVDTQIKNIRKKIGEGIIETVHGVGYKLNAVRHPHV
jgi:two-component system response regulator VanR